MTLQRKYNPLKGVVGGEEVWYWFREGVTDELTRDNVLVDEECQLPDSLFYQLSIEVIINPHCCMYTSRRAAENDLARALKRISPPLLGDQQ